MKFFGQMAVYACEDTPFNSGAEGKIYATTDGRYCIKVYKDPGFLHEAERRIGHMLSNKPPVMTYCDGAPLFAWPIEKVFKDTARTKFCGFCMPRLSRDYRSIIVALRLGERREFFGEESLALTASLAYNLVEGCRSLNAAGYHLADLGSVNLLVNKHGQIVRVDCDNLSFKENGISFTPECSTFEYLPPELQQFKKQMSPPFNGYADRFMIAVLIWQLLLLNTHPFQQGHWNGKKQGCVIASNIAYGNSMWESPPPGKGCPDVARLLPVSTVDMFRRVFSYSHEDLDRNIETVILKRPSLMECKRNSRCSLPEGDHSTGMIPENLQARVSEIWRLVPKEMQA